MFEIQNGNKVRFMLAENGKMNLQRFTENISYR